jgi:hypothetical protein
LDVDIPHNVVRTLVLDSVCSDLIRMSMLTVHTS